jgi:hypothetical protein
MVKFMLTTALLAVACNFANAAEVPAICKGQYAIHYTKAHMTKFAAQTVREMSVKLSDDGLLIIAVRLKGDKDATQYSRTFHCGPSLLCTNNEDVHSQSLQLTKRNNKLIVKNLYLLTLYDQDGRVHTTLMNKPGGDSVFELNQLANVRDCT